MKRCLIFWLVWPVAFSLAAGDSNSDHEEFAYQPKRWRNGLERRKGL